MDDTGSERSSDEHSINSITRNTCLIGFAPVEKLIEYINIDQPWIHDTDDRNRREIVREKHAIASEQVSSLDYSLTQHIIQPLPENKNIREYIADFVQTGGFKEAIQDTPDHKWDIGLVPIDKLISSQFAVESDAYEKIALWSDNMIESLQAMLPVTKFDVNFRQNFKTDRGVGMELTSRSPNFDIASLQFASGKNDQERRVIANLRMKPNFLWVVRFAGRLIVKDGHHRAYQYLLNGETHVPAVVQDIDQYESIGHSGGMFDRETLLGDRPPIIPDFTSSAAIGVDTHAMNTLIRITAEKTKTFR